MNRLPLRIDAHFFPKIKVEANLDFALDVDKSVTPDIATHVELAQHTEDPRRWQVSLTIQTGEAAKGQPYNIELQAVGLFTVGDEVEESRMAKIVHANGAAILYSSAREFLLTVTGRGPWGAQYLPTTNFLQASHEKPGTESKSAPRKKRTPRHG